MTRNAIGRILFTFSCVIAMVLVFGQQASNNHAYAAPKNDPRDVTYVEQNITWTGFDSNDYKIEYENAGMFSSRPTKPSNGKVVVRVSANVSQKPQSRTGKVYALKYNSYAKTYARVATLTVNQSGHSHSWSSWKTRTAATCTANGSQYRTCAVCKKEETSSIPYTNHLFQNWTVTKQPTCGVAGVETGTCSKCGAKKTRDYGSATGRHTYGSWYVSKNPTCSGAGTETHKCTGCGRTENRTIGSYGHVYAQTNCVAKSGTSSKMEITMKCTRCGGTIICNDASRPVKSGSDIILCYSRPDNAGDFKKQAGSFFDYKAYEGNYGHDTYLFYYTIYAEYNSIWNNFIPQKVRHFYDYGHEYGNFSREFLTEHIQLERVLFGEEYGGLKKLNKKNVQGNVYIFTCNAGTHSDETSKLNPPPDMKVPQSKIEEMSIIFDHKYSTLTYYAYLCPDTYVIGIKDDGIDFDEYDDKTDVWLPTPNGLHGIQHTFDTPGNFVAEYFDSEQNKCQKTMVLGTSIYATNFLESYL